MEDSGSKRVVYTGLAVNVAILVAKGAAAALTGSSAMLAECFHSTVDTGNSVLLLIGMRRSREPADEAHPFGHGKALYFWTFVVAVSMFAVGGVMSIYEGIQHLIHPEPIRSAIWAYVVLGISACFSTVSLVIGLREMNRRRGSLSLLRFIRRSKDPTVFTVVLEDIGDVAGELTAMLAIFLTARLGIAYFDGIGSILVGLAMISVSWLLADESRGLLIGESADSEQVEAIKKLVSADPAVERVGQLLTMQLGPENVLLNLEIEFYAQGSIDALEQTIDRITRRIQEAHPTVKHVYLEAASLKSTASAQPKQT
jgi:cation diffusion facilitator family transporter